MKEMVIYHSINAWHTVLFNRGHGIFKNKLINEYTNSLIGVHTEDFKTWKSWLDWTT